MSEVETIKIRELNLELIQPNTETFMDPKPQGSKILIIGVPGSGKSWLMADILYSKKHIFPVAKVMSGTEITNRFFVKMIPNTFIFTKYDEEEIKKVKKRQQLACEHLEEGKYSVFVLDDLTDDPSLLRRPIQQDLFKNGRHYNFLYLLSLQYSIDVRPSIRTSITGTFIFREPSLRNRKILYENYASIIPDFKMFCAIMDQITGDHTALYVHNSSDSNNWQDCVFWYKAKKVPDNFKFGCEDYWRYHFDRYNPEYVDPIDI